MAGSPGDQRFSELASPAPQPVTGGGYLHSFHAMGSPCEVRMDSDDLDLVASLARSAEAEARRIERKFSRYRGDSVVSLINGSSGSEQGVEVDGETAALLEYAAQFHALTRGLFDVTSGVLRKAWKFDGSDRVPSREAVAALLPLVGWEKVSWSPPRIRLPAGMEIDFGGFGKEYAVDSALTKLTLLAPSTPVLVNFGGDLRASGPKRDGSAWSVGIEAVTDQGDGGAVLELYEGALTTSGDARRYLLRQGVRYSHILDPRTGWPVESPPRSVTVAAPTCIEAGLLSTLAMLHGAGARAFLAAEGIRHWVTDA